jgi:hypothetical protein
LYGLNYCSACEMNELVGSLQISKLMHIHVELHGPFVKKFTTCNTIAHHECRQLCFFLEHTRGHRNFQLVRDIRILAKHTIRVNLNKIFMDTSSYRACDISSLPSHSRKGNIWSRPVPFHRSLPPPSTPRHWESRTSIAPSRHPFPHAHLC